MAKVRWHARNKCWMAHLGARDNRGKRKPVYGPFAGLPQTEAGRIQAQQLADEIDAKLAAAPVSELTVELLVNRYLADTEYAKRKATDTNHTRYLQLFCDFKPSPTATPYGLRPANQIRAIELQAMVDAWTKANKSPGYCAHLVSAVRGCWKWAATPQVGRQPEKLLPEVLMYSVRSPRSSSKPVRYADRAEIAKFLRFVWRDINKIETEYPGKRCHVCYRACKPGPCQRPHHDTACIARETVLLIRLAAHTGCRPGEVRLLEWDEIDWAQNAIVQHKGKIWMATGNPRIILVPKIIMRALRRHYEQGPRDEKLCFTHGPRGRKGSKGARYPWTESALAGRISAWREAAYNAGVVSQKAGPNRFYLTRLRHTSITEALHAGVATPLVAELHGTSEAQVRRVYGHVQLEALKRAAKQIEESRRLPKVH